MVKVKVLKPPKFWRETAIPTKSLLTGTYYSKLQSTNYGTWSGPVDATFTSESFGLRKRGGGRWSNESVVIFRVTTFRFEKVVHCPTNHNVCKVEFFRRQSGHSMKGFFNIVPLHNPTTVLTTNAYFEDVQY